MSSCRNCLAKLKKFITLGLIYRANRIVKQRTWKPKLFQLVALKQSIELLVDGQDGLTPNGIEETGTSFRHDKPGLT